MEVTRVEQRACIKIAVLRERNAMECHSELVEILGNNALPYRTVARWIGKFQRQPVMSSVRDDRSANNDFYLNLNPKEAEKGRDCGCVVD
ncbi:HTH_48 domain-containing protein [Trichonephila clavipes]|nr:HTH_48 domain-containing protein [Trichonephila clavipes]